MKIEFTKEWCMNMAKHEEAMEDMADICVHGQLGQHCPQCDDALTIARLQAELDTLAAVIAEIMKAVGMLERPAGQ